MFYLGLSMQASGQAQEAERLLLDEYESYGDKTDIYALFLLQSLVSSTLIPASLSRPGKLRRCWFRGQPAAGWPS